MRPSCKNCVLKHLGQASILMDEAQLGYPEHKWLAIGHMAEAESEALDQQPLIAVRIREERILYMESDEYAVQIIGLIKLVMEKDNEKDTHSDRSNGRTVQNATDSSKG